MIRSAGRSLVASVVGSEWARLANKAESLSEKGQHAEAVLIAKQALQMAEETLEPTHIDRAVLMNCVARQLAALGQFVEAEPLFRRSLEIAEKVLGPDDLWVGVSLNELAEVCDAQGKADETESMYLRALTICEKKRGDELGLDPRHVDRSFEATIATNLASLYLRQEHFDQAESLYKRAEKIWRDYSGLLGKKHPNTALTLKGLAKLYRKTGREEKATKLEK